MSDRYTNGTDERRDASTADLMRELSEQTSEDGVDSVKEDVQWTKSRAQQRRN